MAEVFLQGDNDWKWQKITRWDMDGPRYRTLFSLHLFAKIAGLTCFALAIAMEFGAVNSSAALDKFTDDDLAFSRKQTLTALKQAGDANAEAGRLRVRADQLELQLAK